MKSVSERFWEKVKAVGGCWEWQAGATRHGYGHFGLNGKIARAPRVAWMLIYGEIPKGTGYHGTCVLHRCDNPSCVNPDHLFLGTMADNNKDKERKGRGRPAYTKGTAHGMAKLTESQVLSIRNDTRGQRVVAPEYGVNQATIQRIRARKTWRHI